MRFAAMILSLIGMAGVTHAQAGFITTTFASNNGGSSGWVNMFDVDVLSSTGLVVTSLEVNISSSVNTPFTIDVYTIPNTYVGNDGNAAAWTKVSSGAGTAVGRDMPTPVDVTDFVLSPGTQGLAIHYMGPSMAYTNGTGNNQTYRNNEIELNLGLVRAGFFTGTTFTPRVWNGTIYYNGGGFTCNASSSLSIGSPGSIDLSGGPTADFYQIAASLGNATTINFGRCSIALNVDDVLRYSVTTGVPFFRGYRGQLSSGAATATFAPPALPALIGVDIYHAAVALGQGGVTDCTNTIKTTLTQ